MKTLIHFSRSIPLGLALGIGLLSISINAQEKVQTKRVQDDDIIRISTSLVQTDVMVFDKQGKFVEGLKPEQFQVKINGSPVDISFLEVVTTGSSEEKAQIAAARGARPATVMGEKPPSPITPVEGRSLFLFVDDLHLQAESLLRTRKVLTKTIDEMTPSDRAVIFTASGQLGVQNLQSDKEALKATIARLAVRAGVRQSVEQPPMGEVAAIAINHGDRSVISYYVNQIRRTDPMLSPEAAEEKVKSRADDIIEQSAPFATYTLTALENLVRELSRVPGRKLLFFISDGFAIENERSMSYTRLGGATQEAARAGVVIYSLNALGLVTGMPDASDRTGFQSDLSRVVYSADTAGQEVLYSLAADTGGRAFVNNNDMNLGIRQALEETSRYYLLAWRPPAEVAERGKVKKIEVNIVGRPELKVRTRKGIAEAISNSLTASASPLDLMEAPKTGGELLTALTSNSLQRDIPASLVVAYNKVPAGTFGLRASLQLPSSSLTFEEANGSKTATVDVAAIVQDQTGKQVSGGNKRISIASDSNVIDPAHKLVFYNYDATLPAGSYQVRVGIRDTKTGRMGVVTESVAIPETSAGQFAVSSLLLNEQTDADDDGESSDRGVRKGVARNFAQSSRIRFLTYVYNGAPAAADDPEPDLNVEARVLRGDQAILNPALREIEIERGADPKAYPYLAEIPIAGLKPGEYTLQITITDLTKKASATQRATFVVE